MPKLFIRSQGTLVERGTAENQWIVGGGDAVPVYLKAAQPGFEPYLVFDPESQKWYAVATQEDDDAFKAGTLSALGETSGGGANQTLSNLSSSVAINQSLVPATGGTLALGSFTKQWTEVDTAAVRSSAILTLSGENGFRFLAGPALSWTWPTTLGDANSVLTNNGSGQLSWVVPADVDAWTLNGSFLYYNGGNVGIGTSNPSFPLSFGGSLGNKIGLYDEGSGTGYGIGVQNEMFQIFTDGGAIGLGVGTTDAFTPYLTVSGTNVVVASSMKFQGSAVVVDASSVSSIDANNRQLLDSALSIDWTARHLVDGVNANPSLDWFNCLLANPVDGTTAINWKQRVVFDANSVSAFDWNNRKLYDSIGGTTLDWENHEATLQVIYEGGAVAIDLGDRQLWDSAGNTSVVWNTRQLVASSGTTVDWSNFWLYDNTVQVSADWNVRQLKTTTGVATVWWGGLLLSDATGNTSVDWGSRALSDENGKQAQAWGATLQSGTTGNRPASTGLAAGYMFFDTTLAKPVWWSGSAWVDATGTAA